jgi:hypothetical protein
LGRSTSIAKPYLFLAKYRKIEMRNILLASAAFVSGSVALAHAQTPAQTPANPSQGQMAAPFGSGPAANNNNNAWGIANTPNGGAAAGALSSEYAPNVIAVPAPGTVVIRLNGRVEVDVNATATNLNTGVAGTTTGGKPNGFKVNPVGIGTNFRLYPGMDGLSANGIRYGAAAEIRENFASGTSNGLAGGTAGSQVSASANSSAETLFLRRAFAYIASDKVGLVRLGQGDGVIGLFDNCIFTSQCWDAGIGGIDAGGNQQTLPSGAAPTWVWLSQVGAEYANSKIVYLSPQVYGFDFGAQYAPSEGNAFSEQSTGTPIQATVCNAAGPLCTNATSGSDASRWFNQFVVGLRYQHNFGAVDFKTYGVYGTANKEDLTTQAYVTPSAARAAFAASGANDTQFLHYDNLSYYKAGIAVTALNITWAVDYIGGRINGQLAEDPTGGAPTNAINTGLTYLKGPITLAVTAGFIDTQGDARLVGVSQRHEFEVAFGGNYKLAPGIQLVAEYQYGTRHQGGFDFNTGTLGINGTTRNSVYQGVSFDTVVTW